MKMIMMMNVLLTCILMSLVTIAVSALDDEGRKVFIAYMGSLPEGEYSPSRHHYEMLKGITNPSSARKYLIRSYHKSFNGFAAYLTHEQQQKLAGMDGVISVFPSEKLELQTTRSWDFMGLPLTTERRPIQESDTIVGVIDGGIWPESESFDDQGYGPIPKKWKGECKGGLNFTCNRKIIGARFYGDHDSARDKVGHGTHVASIIAGNQVTNANYYGLAQGTARGGVPSARLAVYKVCDEYCHDADILRAFDDAIADGVAIISISITKKAPTETTSDSIAIGAFHAMEKDILTISCAGNEGPTFASVTNYAPWIFTVAASNIDRRFVDKVLLGDGTTLMGNSINAFNSSRQELPLVYGKQVTNVCSEIDARNCISKCLHNSLVKQKVVICDRNVYGDTLKASAALGFIIPDIARNFSMVKPLPVATLNKNDIGLLKTYHESTKTPKVRLFKSEAVHNPVAPRVASFSSRGPSLFMSDIIKPDIMAPGVEILAAFSPMGSPSQSFVDKTSVNYNILSGTSVACPHVAAAAAFVKSFHPNWSPSAVKSALMTTAWEIDPKHDSGAEFSYGSGHIDPLRAKNPGLVYETAKQNYLNIWCNINNRDDVPCPPKSRLRELNYPSMAVQIDMTSRFVVSFPRTVTNVGRPNSSYVASIRGGSNLHITIDPNNLQFTALNQKKSFVVTVKGEGYNSSMESVSLLWTDGIHKVRSPIMLYAGGSTYTSRSSTPPESCKTYVIVFLGIIIAYCISST